MLWSSRVTRASPHTPIEAKAATKIAADAALRLSKIDKVLMHYVKEYARVSARKG